MVINCDYDDSCETYFDADGDGGNVNCNGVDIDGTDKEIDDDDDDGHRGNNDDTDETDDDDGDDGDSDHDDGNNCKSYDSAGNDYDIASDWFLLMMITPISM